MDRLMESAKIIAAQFVQVGINAEAKFPDYSKYNDIDICKFSAAISNSGSQMTVSPWTSFNWLFNSPISENMYNGNFGKYSNQEIV